MPALVHLHFTTAALWWQHTGTGEQPKPYLQTVQLLVVCMPERAMRGMFLLQRLLPTITFDLSRADTKRVGGISSGQTPRSSKLRSWQIHAANHV